MLEDLQKAINTPLPAYVGNPEYTVIPLSKISSTDKQRLNLFGLDDSVSVFAEVTNNSIGWGDEYAVRPREKPLIVTHLKPADYLEMAKKQAQNTKVSCCFWSAITGIMVWGILTY